jgi:hypothetical protein
MDIQSMLQIKVIPYVELNFKTQSTGTFEFVYGFDFTPDRKNESINMVAPGSRYDTALYDVDIYGGQSDTARFIHMLGNGKFFQFMLRNKNNNEAFSFNGMEFPVQQATVGAITV